MFKKRVFTFIAVLFAGISFVAAQDETGFGMSSDLTVGYKDKVVSTTLGYDFGYKFIPGLYVGAGPVVGGSFGNGSSTFSVGGYGKVRYTLPLDSSVRPFVDGRVGYSYDLTNSAGGMLYGFGLGIHFAEKFKVGVYCFIDSATEMEEYTYKTSFTTGSGRNKKTHYIKHTGTKEVDKTTFTPALLLSMEF